MTRRCCKGLKMERRLIVVALVALMVLPALAAAEDIRLTMCPVKLEIRNETTSGPLLGTYYANSACPGSSGVSSSPAKVAPGGTLCYLITYYNDGNADMTAKNYALYGRPISTVSELKTCPDLGSNHDDSVAATENGALPPGGTITLWACGKIFEDAAPGVCYLHSYLSQSVPVGAVEHSWINWNDAINITSGPKSAIVRKDFGVGVWDPADAYTGAKNQVDLSKLSGKDDSDIVRTQKIVVSNDASSKGNFTGYIACNGHPGWVVKDIVDLEPGQTIEGTAQWPKSVFAGTPAGSVSVNCCVFDRSGNYLDCNWGSVNTFSSDAGAIVIVNFGTDKASYEGGESGTLTITITNNGGDMGGESTADLSLTDDTTGGIILPSTTVQVGQMPSTTSKTLSTQFTVPSDLAFMNTFTICVDFEPVDSANNPFRSLSVWAGGWGGTTSLPYCLQIKPTTSNEATCSELEQVGIPRQNCTCTSRYCVIEAPPGYQISEITYKDAAGRRHTVEDRRVAYLVNANGINIDVEYMKGVVPSLDLSLLTVLLLAACAAFFYRSPHRPQARK